MKAVYYSKWVFLGHFTSAAREREGPGLPHWRRRKDGRQRRKSGFSILFDLNSKQR